MPNRILATAFLGTLFLVTGCENSAPVSQSTDSPALAQAPATGNGNKEVFSIDEDLPSADCGGGEILDGHLDGWFQVRVFGQPSNRNVELDIFHLVWTFTSSAGETFTFRDVGPDQYYIEDGNLIIATTGRSTGSGVIGHVRTNLTTGEVVFVAGNEFGSVVALACEALT